MRRAQGLAPLEIACERRRADGDAPAGYGSDADDDPNSFRNE
jgi:hypothetical protein